MRRVAPALLLVFLGACEDGQGPSTGALEPMRVTNANAQFIPGPLPGSPPVVSDGGTTTPAPADGGAPKTLALQIGGLPSVAFGMAGAPFAATATSDTIAVGVRMKDFGTGYWVVPVAAPDSTDPTQTMLGITTSFSQDLPAGRQDLRFVALGPDGTAGVQDNVSLCIGARIPDNGYACDNTVQPPGAVFTLEWDTNFDLDLHIITPEGLDINPKVPFGEAIEAGAHGPPTDIQPSIDRDSLRQCTPDGLRQEDVIVPLGLKNGTYLVYVDPFAACGQAAVHFKYTLTRLSGTCPACTFGPVTTKSGEILASQVTGGGSPALFVDQIDVH